MNNLKKTHDKDIPQVWYRSKGLLRPVSNFRATAVLLKPSQLQHDTSTTWFQTLNLIQSNRTAVAENKTKKDRNQVKLLLCSMARLALLKSNIIQSIEFGTAVA